MRSDLRFPSRDMIDAVKEVDVARLATQAAQARPQNMSFSMAR
jgi:hypothetical protein